MSEPSRVEVDNYSNDFQKNFDEKAISIWIKRSQKEGLCGILNCYNKPITKCEKCINYYCQEHMRTHLDFEDMMK
jgi:hypothetical protein